MRLYEELEETFSSIAAASHLNDLTKALTGLRKPFGLANVAYHAIRLPGVDGLHPLLLLTYDPEWVQRYTERNYFGIDPVVLCGRKGFLPLDWTEVDRETPAATGFFSEADKFDVGRNGITLPVRGPGGERALFTVTSNASDAEWRRKRFVYMREFQLIAHFFHDRAVQLGGFRLPGGLLNLSRREKDCLQGIVDGDAPKRIAGRLGLSTNAVQLYLQSARHKLGCGSIAEAAVKVDRLELLDR